ncbi:hypothetical protein V6N13_094350 [Hibiscus sabdariffa]
MLQTLSLVHSKFPATVRNFLKNCCSIYVSEEWVLILELNRWFSRRKLVCPGEILVIGGKGEVSAFLCLVFYLSGLSSFVLIVKHPRMMKNVNTLRESAQQTCKKLFDTIVAEYVTLQGKLSVIVYSTDMDGCISLQAQTSKWKRLTREGNAKEQHKVTKCTINDVLQPGQQIGDEGDNDPKFASVLHSKKGKGRGSSSSEKSKNNDGKNLEACSNVDLEKIAPDPNLPLLQNQDRMDNYKEYPSSQSQIPFPIKVNDKGSNLPSNHIGISIGNQLDHEKDKTSYNSFVSLHNQTHSTLEAISKGTSPQGYQKRKDIGNWLLDGLQDLKFSLSKKWKSCVMKKVIFYEEKMEIPIFEVIVNESMRVKGVEGFLADKSTEAVIATPESNVQADGLYQDHPHHI